MFSAAAWQASLAAALAAFCVHAGAQSTYDLTAPLAGFSGYHATGISGTLSTSANGTFSGAAQIETVLNAATYSASISDDTGVLSTVDNSNARWLLNGLAAMTIDSAGITLLLSTPIEISDSVLLLKSYDVFTVLQYRQSNNVTDGNFADFEFNALHDAYKPLPYATSFFFPVVAVPEPETYALMLVGLGLIGWRAKRSNTV